MHLPIVVEGLLSIGNGLCKMVQPFIMQTQRLNCWRRNLVIRVISRRTDNPWAAHSPDLNPCDFFLWGYSKDNAYAGNPTTLQDLKTAITGFIRAIPADTCKRGIGNFAVRLNECLNRRDAHTEHILWMSKLLQTALKLEMNTRDKIPWNMLQDDIWQISVSKSV